MAEGKAFAKETLQVRAEIHHADRDCQSYNTQLRSISFACLTDHRAPSIVTTWVQAELGLPVDPSAPLFGFIGARCTLQLQSSAHRHACAAPCNPVTMPKHSLKAIADALGVASHTVPVQFKVHTIFHVYSQWCGPAGRLEEQKGVDVLLEALPQVLGGGSGAQVVVLGTGKKALEQQVARMESQFPSSAKGVVEFNGTTALRSRPMPCQAQRNAALWNAGWARVFTTACFNMQLCTSLCLQVRWRT